MEDKKKDVEELMKHCCGCPYFNYGGDDSGGVFLCELLKYECYDKANSDEEEDECEDADVIAIVTYNKEGEIIGFDRVSEYAENCPRDVVYYEVGAMSVQVYHDVGFGILKEAFDANGMVSYILFDYNGEWVQPLYSFDISN